MFLTSQALTVLLAFQSAPALSAPTAEPLPRRGTLGTPFTPLPADQAAKYQLKSGEGLVAGQPMAGLTGDKAGLKPGDVVVSVNGKPVKAQGFSASVREFKVGAPVEFGVVRNGQTMKLSANLVEKPRDPGNENYAVTYSQILSHGKRMRTIITSPKKPGKFPALMFIQGFSPVSYDFTLATSTGDVTSLDGPILHEFANSNFVTMRVEKPGVGDSEGGPFAEMDYTTELDIYRQALVQLKAQGGVDKDNVFIFGHSMGGAFGPMVAAENPVKGICVYGVAARTWFEYLIDIIRYQGIVAGDNLVHTDESVRQGTRLMALAFLDNLSADQIKKDHPELAAVCDQYFPNGRFNDKALEFWRQLGQINFPEYWQKTNAYVLAVHGKSDFVTYDVDHKLIADAVNEAHPGKGSWMVLPKSDHLFHGYETEAESLRGFQRGKFNPDFTQALMKWIREVMDKVEDKSGG
ncbi:MAG: alpha/beta fold hydrolase [Armatimonadetes bacterium]|nr:alpha/beta fold hydrolase [Armatimonadota bacterium]